MIITETELGPIEKTIEVPCGQRQAFRVFVNVMNTWWPLDKYSMSVTKGSPAKTIRVEAHVGGTITEIGGDDAEYPWGTFVGFDPHASLAMDFHWQPVAVRTLIQVQFTPIGDDRTRVDLTQSRWQGLGDAAAKIRDSYEGWMGRRLRHRLQGRLRRLEAVQATSDRFFNIPSKQHPSPRGKPRESRAACRPNQTPFIASSFAPITRRLTIAHFAWPTSIR